MRKMTSASGGTDHDEELDAEEHEYFMREALNMVCPSPLHFALSLILCVLCLVL